MGLFPPLVAINFLVTAAFATGVGIPCGRALSVFFKLQPIANCFSIAFGQGLLGPGSYSFSQKNNKRVRSLFYYALTITLVLQFIFVPIIVFAPVSIAKIWLHEEDTLNYAKKLLPKPFFTNWTTACNEVVTALLQCMGYAWVAMAPSIVRGIFYIVYSLILYYTNKFDSIRMIYTYCLNDTTILILDIIIVIKPLIQLYSETTSLDDSKSDSKKDDSTTPTDMEDEDDKEMICESL
ncbi:multidrug resistance protein YPNP-related family [Trichomonas vaginalis G3]|nr:multidrug resistance protein YPNP-related family [Trichomonas vaginalis G3]KAI5519932.1 multidrug resistance protein YPNP-related family [Trichomonas vaginalis G3]